MGKLQKVDYLIKDGVYCLCCRRGPGIHNSAEYRITPPLATHNFHPVMSA